MHTHHGKQQRTMSKLAIFICTVLIASVANGSDVSDALVSGEAMIDRLIVATIKATKQTFDDAKPKTEEHAVKLEAAAKAANEKAFQEVKSALDQVQMEIDQLAGKNDVSKIADCNKLISHLENIGFVAIVKMSECVDGKLASGSEYRQNIITLSENFLANLTVMREEARHCGDNVNANFDDSVDGTANAVAAIKCIDMAELKAAWVEATAVPFLTFEITKITNSLVTLEASVADCSNINEFDTFYRESSTVVERTKQCIHQMKYEARPGTEEVTTEKV